MQANGHYINCDDALYGYVGEAILSHPGVILCQYDQGLRTGHDMLRVAIQEMAHALIRFGGDRSVISEDDDALVYGDGWCDDPDDAEALHDLMQSHENALPSGVTSVWNGDAGTWQILDLRDETLGPVLSAWNDAYPDWLD